MDNSNQIGLFLHQIGVSSKYAGFDFLILAIILLLQENGFYTMKQLYEEIARMRNCTAYMVERNIRTCIEASWYKISYENVVKVFGDTVNYENDRPSNREFILNIFDYYRFTCRL